MVTVVYRYISQPFILCNVNLTCQSFLVWGVWAPLACYSTWLKNLLPSQVLRGNCRQKLISWDFLFSCFSSHCFLFWFIVQIRFPDSLSSIILIHYSLISLLYSPTCTRPWACRLQGKWWTQTSGSTPSCSTSRTTCVSGGQRSRPRSTASPSESARASGSPWSRSKFTVE